MVSFEVSISHQRKVPKLFKGFVKEANMPFALVFSCLMALLSGWNPAQAQLQGPGLGNLSYNENQVFQTLTVLESNQHGHGSMQMLNGYLVVIYGKDSGLRGGGISFYDFSNPASPELVFDTVSSVTNTIREPHGPSYMFKDGKTYVCMQAIEGLHFWDWTDVRNPRLLTYLKMEGIQESDYDNGVWWTSWQGGYLYAGGSNNGVYIVEASDPENPQVVKRVPTSQTGGFRTGPVYAVGNLLVVSNMDTDQKGVSTLDISDPENPVLLKTVMNDMGYSTLVSGHKIFAIGQTLDVYDIEDPTDIVFMGRSENLLDKGGYASLQDNYIHMGSSIRYSKVDISNPASPRLEGYGSSGISGRDEDFASVIGNVVIVGNDHIEGSAIMPHQSEPDSKGPEVNMIVPQDGAVQQSVKSRIGLTFTDNIETGTLTPENLKLHRLGDTASLPVIFSQQVGLVNITPVAELEEEVAYQITIKAGGLKDIAGNPIEDEFISQFSTGDEITPTAPDALLESSVKTRWEPQSLTLHVGSITSGTYLRLSTSKGKTVDSWLATGSQSTRPLKGKIKQRGVFFLQITLPGHQPVGRKIFVEIAKG